MAVRIGKYISFDDESRSETTTFSPTIGKEILVSFKDNDGETGSRIILRKDIPKLITYLQDFVDDYS